MDFLYPIYIAGALTMAVPILIHLLTRRQRKRILFSDLVLLRKVDAEEAARYRWEHVRLLALRALMCVVLALLFCQPVLKLGSGLLRRPGQGNAVALVIDSSRSMGASEGGVIRFEKAREKALQILDLLKGEDEAIAFFASTHTRASHAEPTSYREEVREAIEQAEVTPYASSFSQAVFRAVEILLKSPVSNREIYLFTDGQKNAILPAPNSWPEGAKTLNGYLGYFSESPDLPNVELADLLVSPLSAKTGEPVQVEAEAIPYGEHLPESAEVDLEIGPTHRLHKKVQLVSGQQASLQFDPFSRSAEEVETGLLKLQADVLESDNTLFYAQPEVRPMKILLSQGGGDDSVLNFIEVAMRILAKLPVMPKLRAEYCKVQDLPESLAQEPADVVLIADPGRVDQKWVQSLTSWMRDGGNLVLAMGTVVGSWVNETLVPQWVPFQLKHWEADPSQASHPASVEFSNPWMDRFQDEKSADWRGVRVWGGWEFAGGSDSGVPSQNLIMLDRGSPLLWQRNVGLGNLSVWLSSLNDDLNDLPRSGLYLALWGEFLRSIAERKGLKPSFTAGDQVPIEVVREDDRPAEIRIILPGGSHQALSVAGTKLTQTVHFSRTDKAGIYKVEFDESRVQHVTPSAFAVNVEPGEADLHGLSADEIEKMFPFPLERFRTGTTLASQLTYSRYGYSLWPFVMLFLILAMSVEAWWGKPA
jgi:hypothetical protein